MAFVGLEDMTGSLEMLVFPNVLRDTSGFLVEDAIVVVSGRVSMREEEEPKLICDRVETLEALQSQPTAGNTNPREQRVAGKRASPPSRGNAPVSISRWPVRIRSPLSGHSGCFEFSTDPRRSMFTSATPKSSPAHRRTYGWI